MALEVIGLGVGRTGTFSLKLALEELGFGPCHHMEEVSPTSAEQLALWTGAVAGDVDWSRNYAGFRSAVDWPTAAFGPELAAAYPNAKFLLTVRDPERWSESFSNTIYRLLQSSEATPADLRPFTAMVTSVIRKTGFSLPSDREGLLHAFNAHVAKTKAVVPASRLLVFDVREGWEPLCRFLDVPVPATPFPRTNSTKDFWTSMETGAPPPRN